MSRLTVWEAETGRPVLTTEDAAEIAGALGKIGVRFERWEGVAVPPDATNEQVLAAYRPWLDKLMGETGAGSADVVSLNEYVALLRRRWPGIAAFMLLGLILYFALSPITRAALQDFGAAMASSGLRFWAVVTGTSSLVHLF